VHCFVWSIDNWSFLIQKWSPKPLPGCPSSILLAPEWLSCSGSDSAHSATVHAGELQPFLLPHLHVWQADTTDLCSCCSVPLSAPPFQHPGAWSFHNRW
jgi:hypothetical protein